LAISGPPAFADLNDVQGNIFGGFLKDHQAFMLLRIDDAKAAKFWLNVLARDHVATSAEVTKFNEIFKQTRARRGYEALHSAWLNVAVTAAGLAKIGVAPTEIALMDPSFTTTNLSDHARTLLLDRGKSDPDHWKPQYRGSTIDVVLILAADDNERLEELIERYSEHACNGGLSIIDVERGDARSDRAGHEHFGFKDGISQPGIRELGDPNGLPASQFIIESSVVPGSVPPVPPGYAPQPTPPVTGPPAWCQNGSYMVFRRLRQYVDQFNAFATDNCPAHLTQDLFRAKIVGRYESGTPLATMNGLPTVDVTSIDPVIGHEDVEQTVREHWNDFAYAADPLGQLMPAAAHIRKTNPRDLVGDSNARRILRRGIAYGKVYSAVPESPDESEAADRGLLFVCYQASIVNQFEFPQQAWANPSTFPVDGQDHGQDLIIGQTQDGPRQFVLPTPTARIPFQNIAPFVVTTGMLYCFQPSLAGLQALAAR